MRKRRDFVGIQCNRKANVQTDLIDVEKKIVPFILISENNEGKRFDWWKDEVYVEKLDVNGANYEQLKTFFKDHDRSTDAAIGKVTNIRVENNCLKADVIFGSDDNSYAIFRKYAEGILTDVSIGYTINTVTVEERKDEDNIVTVTDFDIRELSAVGIGFDKGATVGRNKDEKDNKMKKTEKVTKVTKVEEREDTTPQTQTKPDVTVVNTDDAVKDERERAAYINTLAVAGEITQERASTFIADGTDKNSINQMILDERQSLSVTVVKSSDDTNVDIKRNIEDAIMLRVGFTPANVSDGASSFAGASLLDMARAMTGYDGFNKQELVERAMSTGDFPLLLGNVANRVIAGAFEEEPSTFELWTESIELPDFRTRNEVSLKNNNGRLEKLKEGSEKKNIEFAQNGEAWALASYGAEFKLTREMIINDDLGVFTNIVAEFGRMARRTSNGLVYDFLQNLGDYTDYTMSDGVAVFHSTHKNLKSPGSALASLTLSAAKAEMRKQKDGAKALNITPKYLMVSPDKERAALQLLNSEADVGGATSGEFNPHKNTFVPIVENELVGNAWYLAAARNTVRVGYLQGTNKQPIVQQISNNIDGAEFKCVFDFGVVVTDHRGLYKNKGE